jgi:hypothetical protein
MDPVQPYCQVIVLGGNMFQRAVCYATDDSLLKRSDLCATSILSDRRNMLP